MCSYFCKNLSVVMYRKFRNVPIFKDFPPICPYFLGFRVGKYAVRKAVPREQCKVIFANGVGRGYLVAATGSAWKLQSTWLLQV